MKNKEFVSILCDDFKEDFKKNPTKENLAILKENEKYIEDFCKKYVKLAEELFKSYNDFFQKATSLNNELCNIARHDKDFNEVTITNKDLDSKYDLQKKIRQIALLLARYNKDLEKEIKEQERATSELLKQHSEQFKTKV